MPGGRPTQRQAIERAAREPEEARRIFEMRVKGMTIEAIAKQFETSPKRVHPLIDKYSKAELVPYVEEYRNLQLERLEYMWQKLVASGRLDKGDPAAISAGIAIQKRLSDNLGLDAPTKMEIEAKIYPRDIELRPMIQAARAKAREEMLAIRGEAEDDTIVEGEIVEEEDDE